MNAKNKKWKRPLLLGVAFVILLGGLFAINYVQSKSTVEQYPDLEKVSISKLLQGFDVTNQPYVGDPNAPVTLIEFADYKCPACKRWTEDVFPLVKEQFVDTGLAVIYFVNYPFLAPDSTLAALASETIYAQNNDYFWRFHELMNTHQGDKKETWATKDFLVDLVKENIPEANLDQFVEDLDNLKYIEQVKIDQEIAIQNGVIHTPTVVLNGVMLEDNTYEAIKAAIDNL